MSGEELRAAAIQGRTKMLRQLLANGANPCSTDMHGLTALHYAIWNKHEEAATVLLANDLGTNMDGDKVSCINQQTNVGLSALHLAAWENPCGVPFIKQLVFAGADRELTDKNGKRPIDLAEEEGQDLVVQELRLPLPDEEACRNAMWILRDEHCVQPARAREIRVRTNFELPDFARNPNPGIPGRPIELDIHEEHIMPLARAGWTNMRGLPSLRCLTFARDQARQNADRRCGLLRLSDRTFHPLTYNPLEKSLEDIETEEHEAQLEREAEERAQRAEEEAAAAAAEARAIEQEKKHVFVSALHAAPEG